MQMTPIPATKIKYRRRHRRSSFPPTLYKNSPLPVMLEANNQVPIKQPRRLQSKLRLDFSISLSCATMCPSVRDSTATIAGPLPDLRPAFDVLDTDRDGRISLTDLKKFYSDLSTSTPLSDEEIAAMISTADSDRNGFVDFNEFERVLTQRERENSTLMEIFRLMDRDGDGKVGFGDLKAYLQMVGLEVGDEEVKAMIDMAGGKLSGGVSFDGLVKLLQNGF